MSEWDFYDWCVFFNMNVCDCARMEMYINSLVGNHYGNRKVLIKREFIFLVF